MKHWAIFPGRTVRAISFRGLQIGGENRFHVVQGRDGRLYVRGRLGLYRITDSGANERLEDTSECSGRAESQGADTRTPLPRAICARANVIILAAPSWHRHIAAIPPWWPAGFATRGGYRFDDRYLTAVIPADNGSFWIAFGALHAVGRVDAGGTTTLRLVTGIGSIRSMAVLGDDVYLAGERCAVAHLRGLTIVERIKGGCVSAARWRTVSAVSAGGATWLLYPDGAVVARSRRGERRWKLPFWPVSVAVTRDGKAYVLGPKDIRRWGHPMIAMLPPAGKARIDNLPMEEADAIDVDGRDRLWIADWLDHAAALVAAPGS
ncbi:MAG TPA: hypothetical protein VGN14_10060 [Candidatus Elarobacter sp.]